MHGTLSRPNHPPLDWVDSTRQMLLARHHLRACASTCRPGDLAPGPRSFASAPPASSFVYDFAIGAARQRGPSKRVCMNPPVTISRLALCLVLSGAHDGLLLYFASAPIPYPLVIRTRKRTVRCVAFRLGVRLSLCRCGDLPAASAAGKTDAQLDYGAFRNDAPNEGVADDSQQPVARSRVDFRPCLPCKSCSKRRLMR